MIPVLIIVAAIALTAGLRGESLGRFWTRMRWKWVAFAVLMLGLGWIAVEAGGFRLGLGEAGISGGLFFLVAAMIGVAAFVAGHLARGLTRRRLRE